MRRIALFGVLLCCAIAPTTASADVPGPITTRVDTILGAGGGTTGMYVKEVGGGVIAGKNESLAFEPASSIKVLLHLYAHVQLQAGNVFPTTQVTLYAGTSGSCPNGAAVNGTEDLTSSLGKMMRVSDNPATRAQWELWTADAGFAPFVANTLGLGQTAFPNYIGCQVANSPTVDDNTTSLTDLGIIYGGVADSSLLSGVWRTSFYDLMSGREQFEDFGFDFTGIWPKLVTMSNQEKPAGLPNSLLQDFRDGMTANHKGGGYGKCLDNNCAQIAEYLSFAGSAVFPTCENGTFTSRSYVWGIFIHDAQNANPGAGNSTAAGTALGNAAAEPLREQLNAALAGWGACYPPKVTVTTVPPVAPPGQSGFFNAANLAANGGGITVNVSATDDSGVTDLVCTDNGNPVAVLSQSGSNPRTGSFTLASDGTHAVECEATDGMTPANTGASDDSSNTATVKIDATPPTVICGATPVFVLNGPGGDVTATVSDALSGPVAALLAAPADVSSAGAKFAELTGEDHAGNTTTVACAYIVAYQFVGFFSPLPKEEVSAGSTVPLKFALADANGVRIADTEAQALADACDVRVFFSGGDPSPNCADYDAGANRFQFNLKTPESASGPHVISVKVFDGAIVLNDENEGVFVK